MSEGRIGLTPDQRVTLGKIVTHFPGLASVVHAQVTRMIVAVLPARDGAITTESQPNALLASVVARVVAGSAHLRADRIPSSRLTVGLLLGQGDDQRRRPVLLVEDDTARNRT